MKIAMIACSEGTFKRSFPNSTRYFFIRTIDDLKDYHGQEVYLSGNFSMHKEWHSINEMLKLMCKGGRVRCVRI
jgi:hypothetical protein